MNTYRVYVLDTSVPANPAAIIAFVQAEKYGDAWKAARAVLSDPNKAEARPLFSDQECKTASTVGHGDHVTVAKIDDLKPRNVKLDKTALQAILDDPKVSAEDKIAAMQAQLAGKPFTPTSASTPAKAGSGARA